MPSLTEILKPHLSAAPRPILTSLNGDNSWLISLPRPATDRAVKTFYHIVSDPWLTGQTSFWPSFVLKISTPQLPAIPSGSAVETTITTIEKLYNPSFSPQDTSLIDAIFLNFHYLDHLHEASLRTFNPAIPVFAAPEAAAIVGKWNYFSHLTVTRDMKSDEAPETLHPGGDLPKWLNVFRLLGHRELNFATAIMFESAPGEREAIIYSPHGIRTDQPSVQAFVRQDVEVLAMLHALKDSFAFGLATTLGVKGGRELEEFIKPRYWVKSHDSLLKYEGIMAWVGWINDVEREGNVVEVENGGCFLLE